VLESRFTVGTGIGLEVGVGVDFSKEVHPAASVAVTRKSPTRAMVTFLFIYSPLKLGISSF
jgi:hypothetical protein